MEFKNNQNKEDREAEDNNEFNALSMVTKKVKTNPRELS